MIGREGFRGTNQNTEFIHNSQGEGCIFISTIQKAGQVLVSTIGT